jgi:hypothetical protein
LALLAVSFVVTVGDNHTFTFPFAKRSKVFGDGFHQRPRVARLQADPRITLQKLSRLNAVPGPPRFVP